MFDILLFLRATSQAAALVWIFGDCCGVKYPAALQRCKLDIPLLAAGSWSVFSVIEFRTGPNEEWKSSGEVRPGPKIEINAADMLLPGSGEAAKYAGEQLKSSMCWQGEWVIQG